MFKPCLPILLALAVLAPGCTSIHRLPDSDSAAAVIAAAGGHAELIDMSQSLDTDSTFYPSMFPALATKNIPFASVISPINLGFHIFPGGSPFVLTGQTRGYCESFTTGEHTGTHMDSPSHFIALGRDIDHIAVEDLVRPAAVIDVRREALENPLLPVDKGMILAWESTHGPIPSGAMVFLLTGAAKQAGDKDTHHPGFTEEAAAYLRTERDISGVGTDSLSPDISGDITFPVHKILLADECMILENVRHLERLPLTGADVLMGPLPIKEGSGSPTRVVGIVNGSARGDYEALDLTHRLDKSMPHVDGRDPLYSDVDIPILDDIRPIEMKLQFIPKGLPIDRDTTARTFVHGYHNGYFSMGVLTGTHVTFPSMSGTGADAADYPIDKLIRPALLVDLTDQADGTSVGMDVLESKLVIPDLTGRVVILHTDRDGKGFKEYRAQPGISEEAARELMRRGVVGILTDAPAIDPPAAAGGPAERAVHEAGGFSGGFVKDPGRLSATSAVLAILPMPIRGTGGAPARILAYQPHRDSRFQLRTPE